MTCSTVQSPPAGSRRRRRRVTHSSPISPAPLCPSSAGQAPMFGWVRPPPPPNLPAGTPPMTGDIPPSGRGTPDSCPCPSRPRSHPRPTSASSCAARSFGAAAPSRAAAREPSPQASPAALGRPPAESPARSGSRHPRSPARRSASALGSPSRDSGPARSRSGPESWGGGSPPAPSRGRTSC
eukprot:7381771-Prymnesium_polylepis.1